MKRIVGWAAFALGFSACAANFTWVGNSQGGGGWNDPSSWAEKAVPGQGDTVFFDSLEPITVQLGAEQALATLSVSNTPCLKFVGLADGGSVLKIRNDTKGGTLTAPIVFDENAHVQFIAGKVWWSSTTIEFLGKLSCNSNGPITLGMISGTDAKYIVRGPVDIPKGVNLAAPIDWNPSSVTPETIVNLAGGCVWLFDTAPTVFSNAVRWTGGTGGVGGSAPLAFASASPDTPASGINQHANPNARVSRTMPFEIRDWFTLCWAQSANNNPIGFQFGSGANVWISGDVTTGVPKDYLAEEETLEGGAFKLVFYGCGTTVRLTGANTFQGKSQRSTAVMFGKGTGYNAIEIDGPGLEVTPFGDSDLYSNDGAGVFIYALTPGKTLLNGFSYGGSVNNVNAYTFGFDGTNDLTVAGNVRFDGNYSNFPVLADATLTFTGRLDPRATHLDFIGTGDVVLDTGSVVTGSTGRVSKHSAGALTLRGTMQGSEYNKGFFAGGRTILDYTRTEESRLNTAKTAGLTDALTLRGTDLVLKGGAFAETVGTDNGATFAAGGTKIRREDGASTIHLGKITRSGNCAVDFESGAATVSIADHANTTLSGHYTADGDRFAAVDANGNVVAADDSIAAKITESKISSRLVENYIVFEPSAAGQVLDMGAAGNPLVANQNGMIFRGDHDFTITGGWLGGADSYGNALVFTCAGTGVVSYDGKLGRYGFTKSGSGTFRFSGTSDLRMSLNLYEGVFEAASATAFSPMSQGSYRVYLNGGTLRTTVDATLQHAMSVGDNGGVIEVADGTTFTQSAAIQTTADGSSGPIVKKGGGTWLPSGDCTAQSELRIEEGVVKLGHEWAIGCSTNRTRAIAPTKILSGATLDVAGFNAHLGNVYLRGGTVTDTTGGGSLGAYTFWGESGTVAVPLTNVQNPESSNYHVANNFRKISAGDVTLSAANEYTGTTFVHEGRLNLTGSVAGTAWIDGGELVGSGAIAGYAYVTGTGALTAAAGATLTLGDKLAVSETGALRIAASKTGAGAFELTAADAAVYLAEGARLEFDLPNGKLGALRGDHVLIRLPEGASVEGMFANFVDGRCIDDFGNRYVINYHGGDGNDVSLFARDQGFKVFVR